MTTTAPRIGVGYDLHRLVPGRALVLGGVAIEHPTGLAGHSDADVVAHAIADAILGALGAGDLGAHFPDSDPVWKGASSLDILADVVGMATARGYRIGNVDATVVAATPRLAPHRDAMRARLAEPLAVSVHEVSIKATTADGTGAEGRGEAIAAHAVVLLLPEEGT